MEYRAFHKTSTVNDSCMKTLTVGIPAYNEEANIVYLLEELLQQNKDGFILERIIVSSDASSDKTDSIVRTFSDRGVDLIANTKREGNAQRQNQIFEASTSDIVVLLNADVLLADENFLKKLITPLLNETADLTSSSYKTIGNKNFFSTLLETSVQIKHVIYSALKNGNNIYNCYGVSRAFSKKMYTSLRFTNSIGEDAFSYLFCIQHKMKFTYVPETFVYIKIPDNLSDHQKQSLRFIQSKKLLEKEFGTQETQREYMLPFTLVLKSVLSYFIKRPLHVMLYICIYLSMIIQSFFTKNIKNTWDIAKSSKQLKANV